MTYVVHPSAIVDEGAQIGDGTRIWHWVRVCGLSAVFTNVYNPRSAVREGLIKP